MKKSKGVCPPAFAVPTARGTFFACFSEHGLLCLSFPGAPPAAARAPQAGPDDADAARRVEDWLKRLSRWTADYVMGVEDEGAGLPVPLDFSGMSEFRRKTTECISRVPRGGTATYAQLALSASGNRSYCRAVAGVCRTNPFPLLVPCHRIVGSGGAPGGFAAGAEWKDYLLGLEKPGRNAQKKI